MALLKIVLSITNKELKLCAFYMFALYQVIPQAPPVCLFMFKGQVNTWVMQSLQAGHQQISQLCSAIDFLL